jgi:hypothetical protein
MPAGGSSAPEAVMSGGSSKRTVTNVNVYAQYGGSAIADANMQKYIADKLASLPIFAGTDMNTTFGG